MSKELNKLAEELLLQTLQSWKAQGSVGLDELHLVAKVFKDTQEEASGPEGMNLDELTDEELVGILNGGVVPNSNESSSSEGTLEKREPELHASTKAIGTEELLPCEHCGDYSCECSQAIW